MNKAQQQRETAINLQLNIIYFKKDLKVNPNCKVSKMMLARNRANLKTHIHAKTS